MTNIYSPLVFGGAALSGVGGGYGFGDISEANSQALVEAAIDLGITTFDTAPIYGFNQSELTLGKILKKRREEVVLISKGGVSWHSSKRVNMTNDPKVIESMLHQSLRNLESDYIDTYLIHYPDPKVDIRFALDVVEKARIQGKVKNIGLSNTNASEIVKALEVCSISLIQNQCNLFYNDFSEIEDLCRLHNLYKMGWGTLDKGILTGRVTKKRKFEDSDFRSWAPWWKKSDWKDRVDKVEGFKKSHPKLDLTHFALNYSKSCVDSIICGAKNIESLEELSHKFGETPSDFTHLVSEFQDEG